MKFTFLDVGRPGVLGDSTIFDQSTLHKNISESVWLGADVPDLGTAGIMERPYTV